MEEGPQRCSKWFRDGKPYNMKLPYTDGPAEELESSEDEDEDGSDRSDDEDEVRRTTRTAAQIV